MARTSQAQAAKDLSSGLKKLPDNFVMCRDVRHAWMVESDFHVEPSQVEGRKIQSLKRVLICGRCETRRHERYISAKYGLDKIGQWYENPEGYQIPGVPRGVKPSHIVQQEMYRRALEKAAHAARGERSAAER